MCQVFLIHIIHNTYRLRLLIVPYAKASPNGTEPRKISSVNQVIAKRLRYARTKITDIHTYTPRILSRSLRLSFLLYACDLIIP